LAGCFFQPFRVHFQLLVQTPAFAFSVLFWIAAAVVIFCSLSFFSDPSPLAPSVPTPLITALSASIRLFSFLEVYSVFLVEVALGGLFPSFSLLLVSVSSRPQHFRWDTPFFFTGLCGFSA